MCIRDSINAEYMGNLTDLAHSEIPGEIVSKSADNCSPLNCWFMCFSHGIPNQKLLQEVKEENWRKRSFSTSETASYFELKKANYIESGEINDLQSKQNDETSDENTSVSYTHLRAHETSLHLVCRLLLEKKKNKYQKYTPYSKNDPKNWYQQPQHNS
eukprot:TRINITY_DN23702_c0_g1_i2.p1 TRINITY_DN23702_c0_g1~~TRINITY_DN23702_c0_g1_i2.p1  ORF type:complete len:169 (-),score=36.68 TRINITY_DN23702_c0_g1_i2:47-520(-)